MRGESCNLKGGTLRIDTYGITSGVCAVAGDGVQMEKVYLLRLSQ